MLRNFLEKVAPARVRPAPDGGPSAATVTPDRQDDRTEQSAADELHRHLTGIADDNAGLLTGTLQSVDLEEIRGALGDQWEQLGPRLLAFAAAWLEGHLGPADEKRPHGDIAFLVRFADRDGKAAGQEAKRLALRLKAALVEQFPQLSDPGAEFHHSETAPAHEVMANRFETAQQLRRRRAGDGADPRLWRSALGDATLQLLRTDAAVTVEALIAQLQDGERDQLVLRTTSIDAAVQRLRLLPAGAGSVPSEDEETSRGAA